MNNFSANYLFSIFIVIHIEKLLEEFSCYDWFSVTIGDYSLELFIKY